MANQDEDISVPISPSGGPNSHIREHLRHYISFPHSPYFAVLLDGPWGIGKTFLLRSLLDDVMVGRKIAYVSLYGMEKKEQIEEALFAALYPRSTGTGARIAGGVLKALLKHVNFEAEFQKSDFLNKF